MAYNLDGRIPRDHLGSASGSPDLSEGERLKQFEPYRAQRL